MLFETQCKQEIRYQALLQALRCCGGVTAYSKLMNISRSRVSNWLNQSDLNIPYEYALLTEELTGVDIERLSPFTEEANKIIKRLRARDKVISIQLRVEDIVIGDQTYFTSLKPNRPVIVANSGLLISGITQLKAYQTSGLQKVPVLLLDLEELLLGKQSLQNFNPPLLISERVAISLGLKQCVGSRQGQRTDLKKVEQLISKNKRSQVQLRRKCDEVKGRTDERIAFILGFSSKDTYRRALLVCQRGIPHLIAALENEEISITKAAKIAKLSEELQLKHLQSYLNQQEEKRDKDFLRTLLKK